MATVLEDASHFAQAEEAEEKAKGFERKASERAQTQDHAKGSERITEGAEAGDCLLDGEAHRQWNGLKMRVLRYIQLRRIGSWRLRTLL